MTCVVPASRLGRKKRKLLPPVKGERLWEKKGDGKSDATENRQAVARTLNPEPEPRFSRFPHHDAIGCIPGGRQTLNSNIMTCVVPASRLGRKKRKLLPPVKGKRL